MSSSVPPLRVTSCNKASVNPGGDFVVYWMTASRRESSDTDRASEGPPSEGECLFMTDSPKAARAALSFRAEVHPSYHVRPRPLNPRLLNIIVGMRLQDRNRAGS